MSSYEILPGTGIPIHVPSGVGASNDGDASGPYAGAVVGAKINPDRRPVSLFERIANRDDLSPGELMWVEAAIRAIDAKPRKIKTFFTTEAQQTDGTTGNLVLPLFTCPTGCEGHVTNVTVDTPNSATIQPSAPYSNAASWMFLSVTNQAIGDNAAVNATRYRPGLVAFAPTASTGPFLPGQWTFNRNASPVLFGGDQLTLVIIGGSIAGILNVTIQATARVEVEGYEGPM